MRTIKLTKGHVALVDNCDYSYLIQWKWCSTGGRAQRAQQIDGRNRGVYMHREVMARMGFSNVARVDRIDRDAHNNQRHNLRPSNASTNGCNRPAPANNKSGYKGVFWHPGVGKWWVYINKNSCRHTLGYFECLHEAARVYNVAALKLHGEFAFLNKVPKKVSERMGV